MPLSSSAFHDLIDEVQQQIEDILDDSELDLDIENSGGILTLIFTDGSQIILSRQEPVKQLWVAARQGGFHFNYDSDSQRWLCTEQQQSLGQWLADLCRQQAGEDIEFPGL